MSPSKKLKIERLKLDSIHIDPANVRSHDDKNINAIMASLQRFGQQKPIVLDQKDIVRAGNGTLEAAKKLGWDSIDVVRSHLTANEMIAYAIADNRTAELATWDDEALAAQLKGLDEELRDIAYEDFEFPDDPIEASEKDDEVPDTEQNEYGVKLGDVWILGNHRLMCGDSTDKVCVDKLMDGAKADMVFTDPPYGIAYTGGSKKRNEIANDAIEVEPFYIAFLSIAKQVSKSGASIYIWHAPSETHNCINAAVKAGWLYKQYIIWKKNNSTFGRQDYHWQHEPCFYGWGSDGSHKWFGDRKQTTVWDIDRPSKSELHPTMKPIELCIKGIFNSSKSEDLIYEPFVGSGSTLIACEKANRTCYGMEIDPHYCSVIIKRWQDFTGKEAVLVGNKQKEGN